MYNRKMIRDYFVNSRYVTGSGINSAFSRKFLFSRHVTYTGMRPFSVPAIQHSIRQLWRFKTALISIVSVYVYGSAKLTGKDDLFGVSLRGFVSIGMM